MNTEPGPPVVDSVVVLHGAWLELAEDALGFQASRLWREARLRPSRRQQQLLDAVRQAMSATNVREDTTPEPTTHDDYMTTAELAEIVGCSERHARRLADRLDARFDGRTKLVPRRAVTEHLGGRQNAAC